jgi:hypothetical protein
MPNCHKINYLRIFRTNPTHKILPINSTYWQFGVPQKYPSAINTSDARQLENIRFMHANKVGTGQLYFQFFSRVIGEVRNPIAQTDPSVIAIALQVSNVFKINLMQPCFGFNREGIGTYRWFNGYFNLRLWL